MAIIDQLNIKKLYDNLAQDAGYPAIAQCSAVESVDESGRHKTILTLADAPLPIVSVSTANGVGGLKIYNMKEGYIKFEGAIANLALRIATAKQADFTDAIPEGDLGIGTAAPVDADALGTDATDDNICTAAGFTCSAYAASDIKLPSEADLLVDGTTAAVGVYLNGLVDAADIDDDVTTEVLVSGTITMYWTNLGDY
jgi:hypothetical protein